MKPLYSGYCKWMAAAVLGSMMLFNGLETADAHDVSDHSYRILECEPADNCFLKIEVAQPDWTNFESATVMDALCGTKLRSDARLRKYDLEGGQSELDPNHQLWSVECQLDSKHSLKTWLLLRGRDRLEYAKFEGLPHGAGLLKSEFDTETGELGGIHLQDNRRGCGWLERWQWDRKIMSFTLVSKRSVTDCREFAPSRWLKQSHEKSRFKSPEEQ